MSEQQDSLVQNAIKLLRRGLSLPRDMQKRLTSEQWKQIEEWKEARRKAVQARDNARAQFTAQRAEFQAKQRMRNQ